jgi:hypothetical protein
MGPMKTDRAITIYLRAGWGRVVTVEQDFVLPAGTTSVTATVSLPIYQLAQNYYAWDVWVDGVKDKDLSLDQASAFSYTSGVSQTSSTAVTFLVPGSTSKHRSLVGTTSTEVEVLSLELAAFPTRWIDYSALDVVSVSLTEMNQLATSNPVAFEALGRWVRAGGQLWICEVGKELEHLSEVSKSWHVPETMVADEVDAASDDNAKSTSASDKADEKPKEKDVQHVVKDGWKVLRFRRFSGDGQIATFLDTRNGVRRAARDPESIARMQNNPNLVKTEERSELNGDNRGRRSPDSSLWFVEQNLGLGKLRAYRGGNEVGTLPLTPTVANPNSAVAGPDTPDELPRALANGLRRTQRWDTRHGMTPDTANTEFAKFLVPGVGMAPVTYFQVLITLFVLFIGPANYWFLKRVKRLHLMVLTVPLAAGITTLALFAYAILADGFDTRVRAESFTTLDQRSGEAACWTRLSYYSGLAPGNGLVMPTDVTLYPILPAWAGDLNAWEERAIVWDGENARLKQGWLNSRTPTQYLTIRAHKTPHQIEMLESGDKLRAKNELGTPIKMLLVVNGEGNFFLGEGVSNDSAAILKAITRDDAVRLITKQVVDNTPQAPAELAVGESDVYALRARARYQPYWRNGSQLSTGKLSENLASNALSTLAGLSGQIGMELPPRSYVAITENGPEVELGVSYAKEESSFHVIEGRW